MKWHHRNRPHWVLEFVTIQNLNIHVHQRFGSGQLVDQPQHMPLTLSEAMVKKSGTDDLGKLVLEDVIRNYFLADEARIPAIRNSED